MFSFRRNAFAPHLSITSLVLSASLQAERSSDGRAARAAFLFAARRWDMLRRRGSRRGLLRDVRPGDGRSIRHLRKESPRRSLAGPTTGTISEGNPVLPKPAKQQNLWHLLVPPTYNLTICDGVVEHQYLYM